MLTESNAIAYYVANEELRGGSNAAARAQVCFVVTAVWIFVALKMQNFMPIDSFFLQ